MGLLALRPGDLLTIPKMALSVGFIRFVSSRTRPKLNMSAFHWTHCLAKLKTPT